MLLHLTQNHLLAHNVYEMSTTKMFPQLAFDSLTSTKVDDGRQAGRPADDIANGSIMLLFRFPLASSH